MTKADTSTYTIARNLNNCNISNTSTTVNKGASYSAIISVGLLRLENVLFNGNDIFCVNSTSSPAKNNCIFIFNNVYFVRQLSEPLMKD